MKIGIKYCGGCNPIIDRKRLAERIMKKLEPGGHSYEFFDFEDCDIILVINGCKTACAEVPSGQRIVNVAGLAIEGWDYSEDRLADEAVRLLTTREAAEE